MRIAISTEEKNGLESTVSHHFGRCPCYVLVDVEDGEIQAVQAVDNPYYSLHQPGMVPTFIHRNAVDVMLSGGMGRRAIDFFQAYGIQVATGANGTVRAALEKYLGGEPGIAEPCQDSLAHHSES